MRYSWRWRGWTGAGSRRKSWTDSRREGGILGDAERAHRLEFHLCRPPWKMEKLFRFPLFMCCVSDVEPICLPGQNCKDPYVHTLSLPHSRCLSLSMSLSLSIFQDFLEGIGRLCWNLQGSFVDSYFSALFSLSPFSAPKPNKAATFQLLNSYIGTTFCLSPCPPVTRDCHPLGVAGREVKAH